MTERSYDSRETITSIADLPKGDGQLIEHPGGVFQLESCWAIPTIGRELGITVGHGYDVKVPAIDLCVENGLCQCCFELQKDCDCFELYSEWCTYITQKFIDKILHVFREEMQAQQELARLAAKKSAAVIWKHEEQRFVEEL